MPAPVQRWGAGPDARPLCASVIEPSSFWMTSAGALSASPSTIGFCWLSSLSPGFGMMSCFPCARPLGPEVLMSGHGAECAMTGDSLLLLRALGAVERAALHAALDALAVEFAADDVVT